MAAFGSDKLVLTWNFLKWSANYLYRYIYLLHCIYNKENHLGSWIAQSHSITFPGVCG